MTGKEMGPLENYGILTNSIDHCEMCGSHNKLEPAFNPDPEPKILCKQCRIGSAELLAEKSTTSPVLRTAQKPIL